MERERYRVEREYWQLKREWEREREKGEGAWKRFWEGTSKRERVNWKRGRRVEELAGQAEREIEKAMEGDGIKHLKEAMKHMGVISAQVVLRAIEGGSIVDSRKSYVALQILKGLGIISRDGEKGKKVVEVEKIELPEDLR